MLNAFVDNGMKAIETNQNYFLAVKNKIVALMNECYAIPANQPYDETAFLFFQEQKFAMENKTIYVHEKGISEDITPFFT